MHINELETVHNNLVDDMNEKFKNFEEKIKEKVEIKKEDEPGSPEEFNIMEVLSE